MLDELLQAMNTSKGVSILIIVLCAIFLSILVRKIAKTSLVKNLANVNSHAKTYVQVICGVCNTAIILLSIYLILNVVGYNIKGVLAGIGVAGVVIGFALQDFLKDIIAALGFIADAAFDVGEYVGINDIEGEISNFNLRKTTINNCTNGFPVTFNNRDIKVVKTLPHYFEYPLPVDNEMSPADSAILLNDIVSSIHDIPEVEDAVNLGIQFFAFGNVVFKIRIFCNRMDRQSITREINNLVYNYYADHGLKITIRDYSVYYKDF